MQGAIARAALCPNARRVTFGCPAARVRHVPRGLSGGGGKWCVAAAAGERGRDVPGVADARPVAEGRHAAGAGPGAVAPPRGARRGSVAGAVALIVGTSIGSGILAVPQRTAPAVSFPSSAHTPQARVRETSLISLPWAGAARRQRGGPPEFISAIRSRKLRAGARTNPPGKDAAARTMISPIITGAVSTSNCHHGPAATSLVYHSISFLTMNDFSYSRIVPVENSAWPRLNNHFFFFFFLKQNRLNNHSTMHSTLAEHRCI